ncbi:MAG: hypothetical protein CYPHOPRED_004522, partial [Cyphobasidiales sp. Tagirdzhanova-0007]
MPSSASNLSRHIPTVDQQQMLDFYGLPGSPSKRCFVTLKNAAGSVDWAHLLDYKAPGPIK